MAGLLARPILPPPGLLERTALVLGGILELLVVPLVAPGLLYDAGLARSIEEWLLSEFREEIEAEPREEVSDDLGDDIL